MIICCVQNTIGGVILLLEARLYRASRVDEDSAVAVFDKFIGEAEGLTICALRFAM